MEKRKFDLEMFWNLPRCSGNFLNGEGSYCALGAGLKAAGYSDEEIYSNFSNPLIEELTSSGHWGEINEIWMTNDGSGRRDANPEKAKRMFLELLMKHDLIEFTEKPTTMEIRENVEAKV